MPKSTITEAKKARVLELYASGTKLDDITRKTGVGRSSIYMILRQDGTPPARNGSAATAEASILVTELRAAHDSLRLELANKQATIEALLAHMTAGTAPEKPARRSRVATPA